MVRYFILVALFILSSCSTMKAGDCNYDYGYAEGMNDGKAGRFMYPPQDDDNICSEKKLTEVKRGYREGYKAGAKLYKSLTTPDRECLEAYGKKVCGYNCASGFGDVRCGDAPDQKCLVAFGKIKCGHDCEAKYGDIECH